MTGQIESGFSNGRIEQNARLQRTQQDIVVAAQKNAVTGLRTGQIAYIVRTRPARSLTRSSPNATFHTHRKPRFIGPCQAGLRPPATHYYGLYINI